jgi:Bifunctional DNA primase/polymerase, N-terminal
MSINTNSNRAATPYKHYGEHGVFTDIGEELVVWLRSQTERLQLAVRAAIRAYEKSGKMRDAALAYAAHGFPIFPLDPVTKKPIPARDKDANGKPIPGTGGFKKATCDPLQIRAWWRDHPRALIGMPMGPVSGVWCLDIDTSEDHADGVAAWNELAAQHEPIVTREHRSATGGPHLIFSWDREQSIGCSLGGLPKQGLSVKGDGSYIAVPPSQRKGRAYTVFKDIDPVDPPEWLIEQILQGRTRSDGVYTGAVTTDPKELADALRFVPNPDDWTEWKNMALRIYAAVKEEGWDLFHAWSQKWECYAGPDDDLECWEQVMGSPPDRTGAEKIFKIAREHGWVRKAKPTYSDEGTHSDAAARDETRRIVREFLQRVGVPESERTVWIDHYFAIQKRLREEGWPPIAYAMLVPTGIGKTTITVEELIVWLHMVMVGPIIYAVPYHKLGGKIEERFAGHGLNVRTFRGRGRPDPLKYDPTKSKRDQIKMCLNPEAVALAVKCRAPVAESCCKNGKMKCRFYDQCGYQGQKPAKDEKVDVWIVASDMLFKAQKVLGEPAAVIIDEAIWRKGLRGIEQKKEDAIAIDSLRSERQLDFMKDVDQRDTARDTLSRALMRGNGGGVERKHLVSAFSVKDCDEIIRREWKLLPKIKLQRGMSKDAIEKLASNSDLVDEIVHTRRVIRVWGAVRELVGNPEIEVSGRLTLKQSSGQRVVTWRGVAPINKQFQVPTLMFDATLPALEVLQVYYPQVEVVANIKVEMPPHVHVRQVLNAPTSSRKLINAKLKDPERHLNEMRRYIYKRWMETGKGTRLSYVRRRSTNGSKVSCPRASPSSTTTTSRVSTTSSTSAYSY